MIVSLLGKKTAWFARKTEDEIYSKCLVFYWASAIANSSIKRIIGGGSYATIISAVICMPIFFFYAGRTIFLFIKKNRTGKLVIPAFFFLMVFAHSCLRGTPFNPMLTLIAWGLLSLFLASIIVSISDYQILYNEFRKMLPAYLILALLVIAASKVSDEYFMHFSFLLVLPMCQCLYELLEERHLLYGIYFLVFFILVVLYGARGPLGCVIAFVVLFFIFKSKRRSIKSLLVLLTIAGYAFYRPVLLFLYGFLDSHGISSRTLWILVNDPSHSSGRDEIYSLARKIINMRPMFGWGVAGERFFMEDYPHSIFYEFLIDYGKPLGFFLLIVMAFLFFLGFIRNKGMAAFFYTVFLASSVSLLWSGSYLSSPSFWISVYMAFYAIRRKKCYSYTGPAVLAFRE